MSAAAAEGYSEAAQLAQFMGLPRWKDYDDLKLIWHIRKGLPTVAVRTTVLKVDPTGRHLVATAMVPSATLKRREGKEISPDRSERLVALARVGLALRRIYKSDNEKIERFLTTRSPFLGMERPIDLAVDTVSGAQLVLNLLGRIEAGVYS